ncbi:MAG: LL-diaminopimelate aminotransferase [Chlamydiae bacterium]|nr:LL-diaminopimelate aminotransferase [Chlamydiota bacterium]
MVKSNPNFFELKREYIFPVIEKKLFEHTAKYPLAEVINVGIGDISLPLAPIVASAISAAVEEMSLTTSMKGYGPSEGYSFLREDIAKHEFEIVNISPEEIFISDGINSEIAYVLELFDPSARVAIADPSYPVYKDSSLIAGKSITLMPCLEENDCLPLPPKNAVDLIYLCTPSNPTGTAMNKKALARFVAYAQEHSAIILYDNAYAAFIHSEDVPKTIYEIPGAEQVAIEFRSFSKSAGFTGLRCGYTIVPKTITVDSLEGKMALIQLWRKKVSIKSNGVSYPVQRGAQSCFTLEGKAQIDAQIKAYKSSATALRNGLENLGYMCYGGKDSPFIWWKIPTGYTSWEFFDILLEKCHIIAIPGSGFGKYGEGFIRLSAFTSLSKVHIALDRIQTLKL